MGGSQPTGKGAQTECGDVLGLLSGLEGDVVRNIRMKPDKSAKAEDWNVWEKRSKGKLGGTLTT